MMNGVRGGLGITSQTIMPGSIESKSMGTRPVVSGYNPIGVALTRGPFRAGIR